jgi:isopropylmalate/homocitrate/citramalate synthase
MIIFVVYFLLDTHRYDPTSLLKSEEVTTKRVRVVGVVKAWLEDHFYDFSEPEVQQALTSFIESMTLTMESSAKQLRRVFEKAQQRNQVICHFSFVSLFIFLVRMINNISTG